MDGSFTGGATRNLICVLLGFGALSACSQKDPAPFPDYAPKVGSSARTAGPNAYDDYVAAANEVDQALGANARSVLLRTNYSVAQHASLSKRISAAILKLDESKARPCQVLAGDSDRAHSYAAEWRLLGRALRWREEEALSRDDYGAGCSAAVEATKFGFDLTGGTPDDASLGFVIADDARKTLSPFLTKMSAQQLTELASEMKAVYIRRPSIAICLKTAGIQMLDTVQHFQDCYRSENYEWMEKNLGPDAKEPIQILKNLHQESDRNRAKFFEALAMAATDQSARLLKDAGLPLGERSYLAAGKTKGDRIWKMSRRLFAIGRPILAMNDSSCARTQLLILEAQIDRSVKQTGKTPGDLTGFTKALTIDPYSGDLFVYRTDTRDYKLYSVGEDLTDNNGETNETFTAPDLTLEHSARW